VPRPERPRPRRAIERRGRAARRRAPRVQRRTGAGVLQRDVVGPPRRRQACLCAVEAAGVRRGAASLFSRLRLESASLGGVPERPKGTGCNPVGSAYGGSNPPAPISRSPTTASRPRRGFAAAGAALAFLVGEIGQGRACVSERRQGRRSR